MICDTCGHFADEHTMAGAREARYCIVPNCQCNGWVRKHDKAEDFLPKDAKLRKILKEIQPEWIIEWDENGLPHKVRRKK